MALLSPSTAGSALNLCGCSDAAYFGSFGISDSLDRGLHCGVGVSGDYFNLWMIPCEDAKYLIRESLPDCLDTCKI